MMMILPGAIREKQFKVYDLILRKIYFKINKQNQCEITGRN